MMTGSNNTIHSFSDVLSESEYYNEKGELVHVVNYKPRIDEVIGVEVRDVITTTHQDDGDIRVEFETVLHLGTIEDYPLRTKK